MSDFKNVSEALANGVEPSLICSTCPWDRFCIAPPEMSAQDIEREMQKSTAQDKELIEQAKANGSAPAFPILGIMSALTTAGRDVLGPMCPVFSVRLKSSSGRSLVDLIRSTMLSWDDNKVGV